MQSAPWLRPWQRDALGTYLADGRDDFLVTATPGAGKTTFALSAARELWDSGVVRRVIIVTPTDHLRTQWRTAATAAGFVLLPAKNGERLAPDAHGAVVTYAQVAARPRIHEGRCRTWPTLVIFDEVHHAGDDRSWGDSVVSAFDLARKRLSVTGTPFRSDDARIPHVTYAEEPDGALVSVSDFTYGYGDGLRDGVVRPVVFAAYSGATQWQNSAGDALSATLGDSDLSRADEQAAWRTALDPNGEWIPHVFSVADDRLTEVRTSTIPDAAGIVLATNQDQARAYADVMFHISGQRPTVVLSDDSDASQQLLEFRDDADQRWAICVRMITEGVDIPRAAVLLMATTSSTPLFFAQSVGRVVRARGANESATVFLPAVRPLLKNAAEIEEDRDHVIAPPDHASPGQLDPPPPEPTDERTGDQWTPVAANAEFAQVISSKRPDADRDFLGLPGLLTPEQEAELLAARDEQAREAAARATSARRKQEHEQQECQQQPPPRPDTDGADPMVLRRRITAAVNAKSAQTGQPHKEIYAGLYRRVPGPKNPDASIRLLRARLGALERDE